MTSSAVSSQLLLAKRLAADAQSFVRRTDAVSCGIAISLLQDAVELYVWAVIKEKNLSVRDQSGFTDNLEALKKADLAMPQVARLQELNKARVNFKHYGNLPAVGQAEKFEIYVTDCLRDAALAHFGVDFDGLSLVDLVAFEDVKEKLKSAEKLLKEGDLNSAACEAAIARKLLFSRFDRYLPKTDWNMSLMDQALESVPGLRGVRVFKYLSQYLDGLRELVFISMARMPIEATVLLQKSLPAASQAMAGNWFFNHRQQYTEEELKKVISYLVDTSLRIQELA